MRSEINLAFQKCKKENRPALLTYTVAGDNTKKKSLEILKSISEHADILELGSHITHLQQMVPKFKIVYRALKNGIKLKDVFQIVKNYKKSKNAKPCILMGYYQMVYRYGERKFIKKCKQVGVNGLIIVDLPYPDNKQFSKIFKKNSITFVQLLSPTTSERMKKLYQALMMVYYISMLSTTGGKLKVFQQKF